MRDSGGDRELIGWGSREEQVGADEGNEEQVNTMTQVKHIRAGTGNHTRGSKDTRQYQNKNMSPKTTEKHSQKVAAVSNPDSYTF